MGVERMILLLKETGGGSGAPLAYVVHAGDAASALARRVAESLRDRGMAVVLHAGGGASSRR